MPIHNPPKDVRLTVVLDSDPATLELLRGPKGDSGQSIQGPPGPKGDAGRSWSREEILALIKEVLKGL